MLSLLSVNVYDIVSVVVTDIKIIITLDDYDRPAKARTYYKTYRWRVVYLLHMSSQMGTK